MIYDGDSVVSQIPRCDVNSSADMPFGKLRRPNASVRKTHMLMKRASQAVEPKNA
jgi:hypothetical protein